MKQGLNLEVLPCARTRPIFLAYEAKPQILPGGQVARVIDIKVLPAYQAIAKLPHSLHKLDFRLVHFNCIVVIILTFRFRVERGFMKIALVHHDAPTGSRSRLTQFLTLAFASLLFTFSALAQSDRGTITGTVTDPSSAAVAGAKVEARNLDNGSTFKTTTNSTGGFHHSVAAKRQIQLTVTAAGFKTANETGIEVLLDQTVKIDVTLQIGQTTDTITVTATAEMLKTDNAEQSMNVSGQKLNELPINFGGGGAAGGGIRNWLSFTYLAPGVAGTSRRTPK